MFKTHLRRGAVAAVLALIAVPFFFMVAVSQDRVPTFTKDVAPIFQEKCESCHRPDSIAPMSLITYQDVRPFAKAIRERVISRNMPPWAVDKTVGIQHFANDRSLSDAQIQTVVRWVDGGTPQGDAKDMPAPKKWPDSSVWNFVQQFGGPPDLIVKSPLYTVPAVAMDAWFKPTVDTGLAEPRFVPRP